MIKTQVAKPSPYSETWVDRLIPYAEKLPNRTYEALVELVNKHNMPDNMADDVIQGLWSRLTATASATQELPPEPGTAKIPAGHVRLYHQTDEKSAVSIGKHGLKLEHAKGIEGPKAIYADEKGFYGSPAEKPTVEFHVPKAEWDPPFVLRDVTPKEILGVHLPWHAHARYIEDDATARERCLSGQFDKLGGDYTEAVKYIKAKYRGKTHATSDENRLDIPLPDGTVLFHFKWPHEVGAPSSHLMANADCYVPAHDISSGSVSVAKDVARKLNQITVAGYDMRQERVRTYTFPNGVCIYYLTSLQRGDEFKAKAKAVGISVKDTEDVTPQMLKAALRSNSAPQQQTVLSPRAQKELEARTQLYHRSRALWKRKHLDITDEERDFLMRVGPALKNNKDLTQADLNELNRLFKDYGIRENETASRIEVAHSTGWGIPLPSSAQEIIHFTLPAGYKFPQTINAPDEAHCYVPAHDSSFGYMAPVPSVYRKLISIRIPGYDWILGPPKIHEFHNKIVVFYLDAYQYAENMDEKLKALGFRIVEATVTSDMLKAADRTEFDLLKKADETTYGRTRALWKKANTRFSPSERSFVQQVGSLLRDGRTPSQKQLTWLENLFTKYGIGEKETASMTTTPKQRLVAAVRTMAATNWTKFWPDVWYKATLLGPLGPFKDRDHVFVKANTEKPLQLGLTLWVFSPSDGKVMHVSKEIFDDTAYISKVKNETGGWDMAHADKKQEARINQAWHPVVQKILNSWKKNDQVSHRLLKGNAIRTNTNAAQRLREMNQTERRPK